MIFGQIDIITRRIRHGGVDGTENSEPVSSREADILYNGQRTNLKNGIKSCIVILSARPSLSGSGLI